MTPLKHQSIFPLLNITSQNSRFLPPYHPGTAALYRHRGIQSGNVSIQYSLTTNRNSYHGCVLYFHFLNVVIRLLVMQNLRMEMASFTKFDTHHVGLGAHLKIQTPCSNTIRSTPCATCSLHVFPKIQLPG